MDILGVWRLQRRQRLMRRAAVLAMLAGVGSWAHSGGIGRTLEVIKGEGVAPAAGAPGSADRSAAKPLRRGEASGGERTARKPLVRRAEKAGTGVGPVAGRIE